MSLKCQKHGGKSQECVNNKTKHFSMKMIKNLFLSTIRQKILVAVSQEKANSWLMKVSRNPIKMIKTGREMSMVSMLV